MEKRLNLLVSRHERQPNNTFSFPCTNPKHITCTRCKRQFFLKGFCPFQGTIPLVLQCGHIICEPCSKTNLTNPCTICNNAIVTTQTEAVSLPLNIYALGVMVSWCNRPLQADDSFISFEQPIVSKISQQSAQGNCHECGTTAILRCVQCAVLLCSACYSKIHGRALQNHIKILLPEATDSGSIRIKTSCMQSCNEALQYYCNNCSVTVCSRCILLMHSKHDFVELKDKNKEFQAEFEDAVDNLDEILQRIHHAQRKVKSAMVFPGELQENGNEKKAFITEHFSQLHGILQNMEEKLIRQLYKPQQELNKKLEAISTELKKYYTEVESALVTAIKVRDNNDNVDLEDFIEKLQTLLAVPCFLIQESEAANQRVEFKKEDIIPILENHCRLVVPTPANFKLVTRDSVPDDYEIEPILRESFKTKSVAKSPSSKSSTLDLTIDSPRTVSALLAEGSSEIVRVTHIVDPGCFYVQQMACQNKIQQLETELAKLTSTTPVISEVMLNKLYLVQSIKTKNYYRGCIVDIKPAKQAFDVFFMDYGITEESIPISNIRILPAQLAVLPMMALKCSLCDIVPKNGKWHPHATQDFSKLICVETTVLMHIVSISGDTYYVDLHILSKQYESITSVKDSLINLGHGNRISPNQLMRMNPKSVRTYYKDTLCLDKYIEVDILYVESPSCIYVRKVGECNQYITKLAREMSNEYENSSHGVFNYVPEKGLPCAARGVNGLWSRAIICDIPTENTVKLFFVDYGYVLEQNFTAIRTLQDKHMTCKSQAIKVSLHKIVPLSTQNGQWSTKAIDFVKEKLNGQKNVKLIPLEKTEDCFYVTIYLSRNTNLSYLMVKKGLAEYIGTSDRVNNSKTSGKQREKGRKGKYVMETDIPYDVDFNEGKDSNSMKDIDDPFKISVLVYQVESPDSIYVADARSQEANVELNLQMQEFYNTYHSVESTAWKKGAICAVYSEKDKSYCRAKILDLKPPGEVIVFFYDLGVEDTVAMEHLHPLHPKFSQISAYLFKVKLAGILPCGGSSNWPSLSIRTLEDIINENQNCKFYISKIEDSDDTTIPVELWVRQVKMDGPLSPTRIEINSINRMLVENGVAIPIKDYALKRDKILASELKQQLKRQLETKAQLSANIKWFKNDDEDATAVNVDIVNSPLLMSSKPLDEEDNLKESFLDKVPLPPELSAWIPAAPIKANQFVAIPTYLDHDCVLYLYSKAENEETINMIQETLNMNYEKYKPKRGTYNWKPGDLCIAEYHANRKWYRGKVISVQEDNTVNVEFVDYGNVEDCMAESLHKKVIFGHIPVQCTKCKIYGLTPDRDRGTLPRKTLDDIHTVLVDRECEVTILDRENEYLIVSITLLPNEYRAEKYDLVSYLTDTLKLNIQPRNENTLNCDINSTSLISLNENSASESPIHIDNSEKSLSISKAEVYSNQNLTIEETTQSDDIIIANSAVYKSIIDTNDSKESTDTTETSWPKGKECIVSSTPQISSTENLSMTYKKMKIPDHIDFIEMELCISINPVKFYGQISENLHCEELHEYYTYFESVMSDLQKYAEEQPRITSLTPGTACCAQFSDELWYRCKILECDKIPESEDAVVKLLYVDFGNEEYKTVNSKKHDLFCLKDEWLELPMMALKCELSNVQVAPDADYDELIPELGKIYDITVIAKITKVEGDTYYVELFEDTNCEVLAYRSVIEQGLFNIVES